MGHSMFLTPQKREELEGLPIYFCSLNYVQKNSTVTKKIRPTSNFSAPHNSGSFNLLAVNGPNILNSSKRVLIKFFNYGHAITCDISTAYRSMKITKLSQSLSRFFWFRDPTDPSSIEECVWLVATYGSSPTGIFFEIGLREHVAPSTENLEVQEMIHNTRFVDDQADSNPDRDKLVKNLKEYIQICQNYGFLHGAVSMTYNYFEGPDQNQPRTLLGITWLPKEDLYTPNTDWNISRKIRGTYKECSLKQMSDVDIDNIQVTRTLISRLLGQSYEPLSSY